VPKITPARPDAHQTHPESNSESEFGAGWCLSCYKDGAFTLAVDAVGRQCLLHGALNATDGGADAPGPAGATSPAGAAQRRSRPPRGRAARQPAPPDRPPRRARTARRAAARQMARAMAYGRRRAAARVAGPGYAPHPGWRHFIAEGWRVLVDQAEALTVVEALVDAQDWRADKRAAWSAILRQLIYAMDWDTGLVAALTARRLGAAGDRAPRTVSRVIAWARDVGLVVVVEHGASAEFLGTDHGRTPTYALVTNTPLPQPPAPTPYPSSDKSAQRSMPVDKTGDPTKSLVEHQPLNGRRLDPATADPPAWPVFGVPQSPPERTAATYCLLARLGLDGGRVSRVPRWRARALLRPWWDAGACPAALLWAIDHHPDRPDHHRGNAIRGATDPLRVLGHRLRPWRNRLAELPPSVTGLRGDYRAAQADRLASAAPAAAPPAPRPNTTSTTTGARAAARAALEQHLAQLRACRDAYRGQPR
jgi:hypothetical protein